jgi:predicted HicB family RNase H-like nuclease
MTRENFKYFEVSPAVHAKAKAAAEKQGVFLRRWVENAVMKALDADKAARTNRKG